jgi:uncharacterized peroxidase-related enzyme
VDLCSFVPSILTISFKNINKMTRLSALSPDEASGKAKELFGVIKSKFGVVSKMMGTMGNSPALLEGFLNFYGGLSAGTLGPKTGELIALAVSESNGCKYCQAAHKYVAKNLVKLDDDVVEAARKGASKDAKTDAILKFAIALLEKKGGVSDKDVASLRAAGVTDNEMGEIIGHVGLNIITNYFNKAVDTELDSFLK